jgi:hypothetical protein
MSKGKWLNNIARVIKKKSGGFFLKFERQKDKNGNYIGENPFPLLVNEGDIFQMRKKEDELARLVESGKMSQATADKITANVKYEISKAPDQAEASETKSETKSSNEKDEVNF